MACRIIITLFALLITLASFNLLSRTSFTAVFIVMPLCALVAVCVMAYRQKSFKLAVTMMLRKLRTVNRMTLSESSPSAVLPKRLVLYITICIATVEFSVICGRAFASVQSTFPVLSTKNTIKRVVITKNGSEVLVKDYDTWNAKFLPGYYVEELSGTTHIIQTLDTSAP